MAWLYDGISSFDGAPVTNFNYKATETLKELELDVLNEAKQSIAHSNHKNTGKQMVYFPSSSTNEQYKIYVTKDEQTTAPIQFAYAWSSSSDINDNIIRSTIYVNNALSEPHTLKLETDMEEYEKIINNGNLTEYQLFGVTSAYDDIHITLDGTSLFSFSDVNPFELTTEYTNSYQLQDGSTINYIISNDNGDIYITVYDSQSCYVQLDDNADAISYYVVENSLTTKYTKSSYVNLGNAFSLRFYDVNGNYLISTNQTSFIESAGYIMGIDAAYKLSSNITNDRKNIVMATYIMGDVNMNGELDSDDSYILLRYLIHLYSFVQTGSTGDLTLGNGNITINGDISANGTFKLNAINANINGQLSAKRFENTVSGNLNMNKPPNSLVFSEDYVQAIFSDEEMDRMYFKEGTVKVEESDYNSNDPNFNLTENTVVKGDVSLNGNININSNLKADGDIVVNGDVENTVDGIIYSKDGNITLDSNNINFNGMIYAPNGTVTLKGSNITITGTIIARELLIEGDSVNFNVAAVDSNNGGDSEIAGLTLTQFQLMLGDVDYNHIIDLIDVIIINKRIMGVA